MKKIFLIGILTVALFLVSCGGSQDLPTEPGAPGTVTQESSAIAGQAVFQGEGKEAYSDSSSFTLGFVNEAEGTVVSEEYLPDWNENSVYEFTTGKTIVLTTDNDLDAVWSGSYDVSSIYFAANDPGAAGMEDRWYAIDNYFDAQIIGGNWKTGGGGVQLSLSEDLVKGGLQPGIYAFTFYACTSQEAGWDCGSGAGEPGVWRLPQIFEIVVDFDEDGTPDEYDDCPEDQYGLVDSDGDSFCDYIDLFPQDPSESSDGDGDGVGDNADLCEEIKATNFDTDQDGCLDFCGGDSPSCPDAHVCLGDLIGTDFFEGVCTFAPESPHEPNPVEVDLTGNVVPNDGLNEVTETQDDDTFEEDFGSEPDGVCDTMAVGNTIELDEYTIYLGTQRQNGEYYVQVTSSDGQMEGLELVTGSSYLLFTGDEFNLVDSGSAAGLFEVCIFSSTDSNGDDLDESFDTGAGFDESSSEDVSAQSDCGEYCDYCWCDEDGNNCECRD